MKHVLSIVLVLIIAISLVGCKIDDLPFLNKDTQVSAEDTELKYKIAKVVLSKGYQSIEPSVEIQKKGNDVRLLVSVGLLETSGVKVSQVVKKGNIINIHVLNEDDEAKIQLAVPQIFLELVNAKSINLDEIKFNIVNENYNTLDIKLGVNEVINKVKSDFNVTANTLPEVNISNVNDRYIWSITYNSIFDKDNYETPLVNLSVDIDANSGEVLKSTKGLISSYIDEGQILDYIMDKFILYKRTEVDMNSATEFESIWCFDISKNERTNLYRTNLDILSANFSPDHKYVSVIESNGAITELFIVKIDEKKAFKVIFEEGIIPSLARWYDNNNLYILDYDNNATNLYSFDVNDNRYEKVNTYEHNIIDIKVKNDVILLVEKNENNINNRIYFTDLNMMRMIDTGFSPRIIDEDRIAYLKKNEKDDRNILHIYDISKYEEYDLIDINVSSISVISNEELFILEKNQAINDYTIHEYDIKNKNLNPLTRVNSPNIYYNKDKHLIYVDLILPYETNKQEIIYSVDVSKLSNIVP